MRKIIITLILTSLFLSSCGVETKQKIKKQYNTITIGTGSITENQEYIGYIQGEIQTMLATKAPGKITYLAKKTGDKIYKGELIASLDSAEAKTGYSTANSIVGSLQSLKGATNQSFEEQIKAMHAKIQQAEAGLNGLETGITDTKRITNSQIETAKLGIITAQTNLEETKKTLESKKSNILAGAKSAITQNIILSENIIDFVDSYLGITPENENKNNAFEDFIGVKNQTIHKETEISFIETKKKYDEYKKYYEEKIENKKPDEKELKLGLKIAESVSESIKDLLDLTYDTLDNSLENTAFSLSMINQYKMQISKLGSDLEKSLMSMSGDTMIGVKGSLENIISFDSENKKAVSLLTKQVEIAKQQLEQYKNMALGQVNEVSTKKEVALKQLQEAKAGLQALIAGKDAKLKEVDSKISEVLGQRNLSAVYINNGKVYSPINGVIVSKNAEVSQIIGAGMPIYTVASDNNVKVKISVPDFVAKSIKINDKVSINIENSNKTYTGTIVQLPNVTNMITKKIELEIMIKNKNKDITIGSMANVNFKIKNILENTQSGTTIIPNQAIIQKYMLPGVYVLKDGKAQFTQIEIFSSDEQYSQVKGLEINSKIITKGKENIYDGEKLN